MEYFLLNNSVYSVNIEGKYIEALIDNTVAKIEVGFNPKIIEWLLSKKNTQKISKNQFNSVYIEAKKMILNKEHYPDDEELKQYIDSLKNTSDKIIISPNTAC